MEQTEVPIVSRTKDKDSSTISKTKRGELTRVKSSKKPLTSQDESWTPRWWEWLITTGNEGNDNEDESHDNKSDGDDDDDGDKDEVTMMRVRTTSNEDKSERDGDNGGENRHERLEMTNWGITRLERK